MINHFGRIFTINSFGESHGKMIGGSIDGVPPKIKINLNRIAQAMKHRKAGKELTSQRNEDDEVEFISGILPNSDDTIITTGTALAFLIHNKDYKLQDYANNKHILRPGHGEYPYLTKYGIFDPHGGGRASARETAIRVCCGSIALQILEQLSPTKPIIEACILQIGTHKISDEAKLQKWSQPLFETYNDNNIFLCPDENIKPIWHEYIKQIRKQGDSIGALIGLRISNIMAGLGSPIYGKISSELASGLMSINAAKAVSFGVGFDAVTMKGSQYNDPLFPSKAKSSQTDKANDHTSLKVKFTSNNHGGIMAGISTHAPIEAMVAFKPTASIAKEIASIDIHGKPTISSVKGRHDPCIGIRAVPIVAAMAAITLLDQFLLHRAQCGEV